MTLRSARLALALALLVGCESKSEDSASSLTAAGTPVATGSPATGSATTPQDADGDGFTDDVDCDDTRADVNPEQDERCNGFDDNCDGVVDTDAIDKITTYADLDGDGSGDDATQTTACTLGPGRVQLGGDCNDSNPGLNARDDDADGDSTCDGDCDDADPALNLDDLDLDGFSTCTDDCDDADPARSPADGDGDGQSGCDGDCDDTNPAVEGLDVDGDGFSTCDGDCDDGDDSLELVDLDGDTWTTCDGDCDDHNPGLNLTDNDGDTWTTCDGDCDDADGLRSLSDVDLDGQTGCAGDCDDADPTVENLDADGDGWTTCDGDCDDADPAIHPGATETCDAADRDCDGDPTAGATDQSWWFLDIDGDGFGVSLTGELACAAPTGNHVDRGGDCDDNLFAVNPAMPEDCTDGVDNDCSGVADDCGAGSAIVDAVNADRRWMGTWQSHAGGALGAADLDGDGADDLVIGGQDYSEITSRAGRAWLFYGDPVAASGPLELQAEATFSSSNSGDRVGSHAAGVGDLDGDGFEELAIGAVQAETPSGSSNAGAVHILWGGAARRSGAATLPAPASLAIYGGYNDRMSSGLGPLGDLDDDGYADLGFAAPNAGSDGRVYLFMGGPTRPGSVNADTLPRVEMGSGDSPCWALAKHCVTGGDLDGDGFSDVAIGVVNGPDSDVYVLYGSAAGPASVTSSTSLPSLHNPRDDGSDYAWGSEMTTLDFDGDGRDDLVVGDPNSAVSATYGGAAWIYLGSPTRWTGQVPHTTAHTVIVSRARGLLAKDLTSAGDIDGDGDDDLLVGAPQHSGVVLGSGVVYLFEGDAVGASLTELDAPLAIVGESEESYFGGAIAVGDFDRDSLMDLAVGAQMAGSELGRAYLLSNPF